MYKDTDPCLAKVADDEPIFVLRASDVLAPVTVSYWMSVAYRRDVNKAKIDAAQDVCRAMHEWQAINGCKVPD